MCRKTVMLRGNNAVTKNFLFNSHPNFIFCGLFLCPCFLGRTNKCLRKLFSGTPMRLEAFKRIFVFRTKIRPFSKGLVKGIWSK